MELKLIEYIWTGGRDLDCRPVGIIITVMAGMRSHKESSWNQKRRGLRMDPWGEMDRAGRP